MNSLTASYWEMLSAAIDRWSVRRLSFWSSDSARRSSGTGRPGTGYSCSPETRSGARLVAMTAMFGQARSRSATTGAPSITCSKLSRTNRTRREPTHSVSMVERRPSAGSRRARWSPAMTDATSARVPDGLERHEPRPVGVAIGDVGRELQGEARLAGPAGARQGQEPGGLEQAARLGQLGLAPDEARQLRRQVVGSAVERPDRRELGPQPVDGELADLLGPEVLEPMLAEAPQLRARRQLIEDERRRGLRQQDLAAVPGAGDPRRPVDVRTDVLAIAVERAVAGVQAHPDVDRHALGPGLGGEPPLGVDRGRHALVDPLEHREDPVALGLLLVAAGRLDRPADEHPVSGEDRRPRLESAATGRAGSSPRCP